MTHTYSLVALLKDDPDFSERLAKKTVEVKKDKESLLKMASDYSEKYHTQIEEGTRKQVKMLSEGNENGLSEEDTMKKVYSGGFVPTKYTPILNLLFFLMNEGSEFDRDAREELNELRKTYDKQYGHLTDEASETLSDSFVEPKDMIKYIYANMSQSTFQKIKKLKALSKSDNENEAFSSYRKCLELCKQYNLDFDKVPCNID